MKLLEVVKSTDNIQLDKKTLVILRWIAIIGQLITINSVRFIFNFVRYGHTYPSEYNYIIKG